MSKKGSLELSITAIVVIVIAFVVLGLGLSLTRLIFKNAEGKLPEAFAVTQLETQPTSENPITISQTVEIDRTKSKTMRVGFYNKGAGTALGATFAVTDCLEKGGKTVDKVPTIASTSQLVQASSAAGYSIILNENGLQAGTYICTIGVKCNPPAGEQCPDFASKTIGTDKFYETKQFFLTVVA